MGFKNKKSIFSRTILFNSFGQIVLQKHVLNNIKFKYYKFLSNIYIK